MIGSCPGHATSEMRPCVKGALCAEVIRLRVSYDQNDETLSRNSLIYMSRSNSEPESYLTLQGSLNQKPRVV